MVFAAASLTDSFTSIGDAFMTANPDSDVTFNFARLVRSRRQHQRGCRRRHLRVGRPGRTWTSSRADGEGTIGDPVTFATNTLEIIVEPGNPQGITGLADLANADLTVVSTDPEVPIGAYTQQVLDAPA